MTLTEAVACFLGPIMAESARLVEEGDPGAELVVEFYGRRHVLTLRALQAMDLAYADAFDRAQKAACRRRDRKAAGLLL